MSKAKSMEVLWDDQQSINEFNRLNTNMHEHEALIRLKKENLVEYEDASNELMLTDEETVRYMVGECFAYMEKDAAEERLAETVRGVEGEIEGHKSEIVKIKKRLQELKAKLYGKFGKSINLEEELE